MSLRARRGYLAAFRTEHRAARRRAGRGAPERRRSVDDRDAGAGALAAGSRRASFTRSTCSSRSTSATSSRRCCSITSRRTCACGRSRAHRRGAAGHRAPVGCRRSGACSAIGIRPCGRRRSARVGPSTTRTPPRSSRPLLERSRSTHPGDGGRRAGRQPGAADDRRARGRGVLELTADDERRRTAPRRRDAARRCDSIDDPRFRRMLMPLLYDPAPEVAEEAMESVRRDRPRGLRSSCPTLVSLLRNRRLKGARARGARQLRRAGRRHAGVFHARHRRGHLGPPPHSRDPGADPDRSSRSTCSSAALEEPDGFLRYKVDRRASDACGAATDTLTFQDPQIEALALREARRYLQLPVAATTTCSSAERCRRRVLLAQALTEKMERTLDRIYLLLALIYPWRDIAAARWTLSTATRAPRERVGVPRQRADRTAAQADHAGARGPAARGEGPARQRRCCKTRPRDVEETLLQLINDDDQVVAAAAIDLVARRSAVVARRRHRARARASATSGTGTCSRPRRGRSRSGGCRPTAGGNCGWNRCRRPTLAGRLRALPLFAIGQRRRAVPHCGQRPPGAARAGHGPAAGRHRPDDRARRCSTAMC